MRRMTFCARPAALALAGILGLAAPAGAQWICEVAAKQTDTDPDGDTLGSRFADGVDCNASGDCLFVAQPVGKRDKLYKYPKVGAAEVIARANSPSVSGCPDFRSSNVFRFWSLNDANDVVFGGTSKVGADVFRKRSGGSLEACAATGNFVDPLNPGAGRFTFFVHLAQTNATGDVVFIAARDVGPICVFECDCAGTCPNPNKCDALLCIGDQTDVPSEVCDLHDVGLGDSGAIAVRADIAPPGQCATAAKAAILYKEGLPAAREVAVVGENCPNPPGGTFASFDRLVAPLVNAADKVGFQGTCTPHRTGIFLWDSNLDSTAKIVLRGEPAATPGNGTLGHIHLFQLTDDDEAIFRTTIAGNTDVPRARFCAFRYDGADEAIQCNNDMPPFGERYINIRDPGASSDGERACARVRIKDVPGSKPLLKTAVIRCQP